MSLIDLQYRNSSGWISMPYWAVSLISLGSAIASPRDPHYRFITGLAVPVRAYAAALIAMGLVSERAKTPFNSIGELEHFEYFKTIAPGSHVLYRVGENWYHGEFIKAEKKADGPFVSVLWINGRKKLPCTLSLNEAKKRIQIVGSTKSAESERVVGHRINYNRKFLQIIVDNDKVDEFVMRSRLECVIIGCVNTLRHEIKETEISFGSRHIAGTFQDVLRARKFLPEGSAYRSNVMPVDREQASLTANQETPYMVIFDGAISFLKWRDYWRRSNWLVLLDKTESCFQEAADQLNNEYVEKRVSDTSIENVLTLPQGIEVISFQEESE
jgi:hypothetical protein